MKPQKHADTEAFPKPGSLELVVPLTEDENATLAKLEEAVDRHLHSFREAADALWTIKNQKLWRENFNSWEDYVDRKWKMSRAYSYRLVDAAEAIRLLEGVAQGDSKALRLPDNERAFRQLCSIVDIQEETKDAMRVVKEAGRTVPEEKDIGPADIQKAAIKLKLYSKPKRVVFELKQNWEAIRDGLAALVKSLKKHDGVEAELAQLEDLLNKAREAVKHCPSVKPKDKPKAGNKTAGKANPRRRAGKAR